MVTRVHGLGDWRLWPRPPRPRAGSRCRRWRPRGASADAGYNLVVLAVAITVLNILVAKALPLWSTVIQREKEEELIFRGLQYAEAIRVFELRNQRLPVRLEELIKVRPRSIRRLWENPMTEDGSWALIFQNQPTQPDPQGRPRRRQERRQQQQQQQQQQPRFSVPGDGQEVRIGPIIGVYSPVGGEAVKIFAPAGAGGGTDVSQWRFTKDLVQALGFQSGERLGGPQGELVPSMNAADIGKPWPPGVQLPQAPRGRQAPRGVGVTPLDQRGRPQGARPQGTPPQGQGPGGQQGQGRGGG